MTNTNPKPTKPKASNSMTVAITTSGAMSIGKAALDAQRQKPKGGKP